MPSNPPFPVVAESRLLAAIVFTDVTGFSARVEAEESAALGLLEQDFAAMREFSGEFGGTILKTTGDGLLLYFTSAVHAVGWALRTQRHFAERARRSPLDRLYRHRIGVHVGDVFLKADDVMGDGVNVAARVQGEAPPGGICISQTVYEVVKNKLDLHVVRLEPRKLKNIRENVQMYHVLLEEPKRPATESAAATYACPRQAAPAARGAKRGLVAGVLLFAALGVAGAVMYRMSARHERELARSRAAQAELSALLAKRQAHAAAAKPANPEAAPAETFDFAKMTGERPPPGDPATAPALREAREFVAALDAWVPGQLAGYTRLRPLLVQDLRGSMADMHFYTDADGQLCFAEGGAVRKLSWPELRPELKGAIIVSLLRSLPSDPPARALRGAEAFAYVNGLPDMAAALLRERSAEALLSR